MIDLTPLDVRNKRGDFRKILRGFDPEEVDAFLQVVEERLEVLVTENLTLKERCERLQEQVSSQEGREKAVQEALVTAQELREQINTQAHREADSLTEQARRESELSAREADERVREMLRDSNDRIRQAFEESERRLAEQQSALEELGRMRAKFLKSFRTLLERELDAVEVEDAREPVDERPLALEFRESEAQIPIVAPPDRSGVLSALLDDTAPEAAPAVEEEPAASAASGDESLPAEAESLPAEVETSPAEEEPSPSGEAEPEPEGVIEKEEATFVDEPTLPFDDEPEAVEEEVTGADSVNAADSATTADSDWDLESVAAAATEAGLADESPADVIMPDALTADELTPDASVADSASTTVQDLDLSFEDEEPAAEPEETGEPVAASPALEEPAAVAADSGPVPPMPATPPLPPVPSAPSVPSVPSVGVDELAPDPPAAADTPAEAPETQEEAGPLGDFGGTQENFFSPGAEAAVEADVPFAPDSPGAATSTPSAPVADDADSYDPEERLDEILRAHSADLNARSLDDVPKRTLEEPPPLGGERVAPDQANRSEGGDGGGHPQ